MRTVISTLSLLLPLISATNPAPSPAESDLDTNSTTPDLKPRDGGGPGQLCFSFTADPGKTWHWVRHNASPGSGTITSEDDGSARFCTSQGDFGMFFGRRESPNLGMATCGATKLECSVNDPNMKRTWCNISLCDGYSVALSCTGFPASATRQSLGDSVGRSNKTPSQCREPSTEKGCERHCTNKGSHSGEGAVDPWFQELGKAGYWYFDSQVGSERMSDWSASEGAEVKCVVGGHPPNNDKRGLEHELEDIQIEAREVGGKSGHRHMRAHRRGLKAVV